ncbi:MAG: type I DNA topoisomerase [Planctomycetota bacterium]|nr:type I DNA topoisomerase [Planctomycetota bacterium]
MAKAFKKRKKNTASSRPGRKLVIVESPAKAKTIHRYLGSGYVIKASMGHVRDLPGREMGVDIGHGFTPTYEPLPSRRKVLAELKKYARSAPEVFLATDLDREGEAIAWHLAESLGVPQNKIRRVVFNQITKTAICEAFANPHGLDMNKVDAQQARRILDRIVGYEISPLLWKKVARGLSAGRVQSVAVRLIVERERQIDAFTPEEYWRISGVFTPNCQGAGELSGQWAAFLATIDAKGNGPTREQQQDFLAANDAFRAELLKWRGKKFEPDNAEETVEVAEALGLKIQNIQRTEHPEAKGPAKNRVVLDVALAESAANFVVQKVSQRDSRSRPPAPFTTAALQQAASVQLRYSASRTMRIAQQLYEGVNIPGSGSVGLITYMRTDSRNLSAESVAECRSFINENFGDKYVPEKPNIFTSGAGAQEAHEAIRPTAVGNSPEDLKGHLTGEQSRLYELIWRRFVACQMPPALWKVTDAEIAAETPAGDAVFKALGRRLAFDGFMRVAGRPKGGDQILPHIEPGKPVAPVAIRPVQHFTPPPPRYTEASLIKALEADGIGRPSTYAAIIQTIQDRRYVELIQRAFHPTDLGGVVTDKLVKHFPKVMDVRFTAHMEQQLDKIEDARAGWVGVLKDFYGPFSKNLKRAGEEMVHAKAESQPSDYVCEACGKPMAYRFSRDGRYLACTGYPKCKTTHPVDSDGRKIKPQAVGVACPKCGEPMLLRRGRYGPFLSCPRYPECDGVVNLDKKGNVKLPAAPPLEVELPCPKCQSPLYLRRSKRGPWLGCSKFPKCRGRVGFKTLDEQQCKELELKLLNHEKDNPRPVIKTLDGATIGYDHQPKPLDTDDEQTPPSPQK